MTAKHVIGTTLSIDGNYSLKRAVSEAEQAGVSGWHIDICNIDFAPSAAGSGTFRLYFQGLCQTPCDVHLMCTFPCDEIEGLAKDGFQSCTPHIEINDVHDAVATMKEQQLSPGFAIQIDTPVSSLGPLLPKLERVLLLSGQIGIAGQGFNKLVLSKIRALKRVRSETNLSFRIGVDGGIYPETAHLCARAGADDFCCGSWIFHGSQGDEPKDTGSITSRVEAMIEAVS